MQWMADFAALKVVVSTIVDEVSTIVVRSPMMMDDGLRMTDEC